MKKLVSIIAFGILVACTGKTKEEPVLSQDITSQIPVFDFAATIGQEVPDTFTWNSIAKKITLTPISTDAKTLIGEAPKLFYAGEDYFYILSYQTNTFYKISKNGKIEHTFRHVGNGPGEYAYTSYTYLNPLDSTIQVFDNGNQKQIYYDLNGRYIKEVSMKEKMFSHPLLITNEYMIIRSLPEGSSLISITDPDMNLRKQLFPFDSTLSIQEKAAIHILTSRSMNRDVVFFNHVSNDTVSTITDKGLTPLFILKKGEYSLPETEIKNFMALLRKGDPHILKHEIGSIPGYYILRYVQNNQFTEEIWSKDRQQLISRFKAANNEYGFPFIFPSGKKVRIHMSSIYIKGNSVALFVPAEDAVGEIPGVKEDDNPILLQMEL